MAQSMHCMHLTLSRNCSTIQHWRSPCKKLWVANSSSNKKSGLASFGERLLDYIEGGPKLRKWYGAPNQLPRDRNVKKKDYNSGEPKKDDIPEIRDAVLVTDGDSDIGQLVILSLIIKRARIKALVKDSKAAISSFGSYIEPIDGDITDKASVKRALKGVHAIICIIKMGVLSEIENLKGIEHIIFLSQLAVFRSHGGIQAFINGKAKSLAEENEMAIITSGIPYTIVRAGLLQDRPGGQFGFNFEGGCASKGSLSKEDAAAICVEALDTSPQKGLIFEVVNGEETVQNWKDLFTSLAKSSNPPL
ncbi:uncharacterized protein At2g37660, chloroplastic isoform X2 [Cryptomeria japonica]|uniref:uncharacterized protein At2g37660, chloroplastic isoform X2 n=1 Tax=Cryptomeria japonica TaxID=3369 RepID=UPI0025AC3273|nr:uncharacterized protein At2g37660, chloroplastic isoform X2 [Cryptomeria japonica]